MNWRQHLAICFVPLAVVMMVVVQGQKAEEKIIKAADRKIASHHHPRLIPRYRKNVPSRTVSALKDRVVKHQLYKNRVPQSVEETFVKSNEVKLSRGYDFLTDVAAIPVENFNPTLGPVIHKDERFVFFRTNPGHSFLPVAISQTTKMLYPIASVVHIRGKDNKFQTIQSTSGEVLKLYEELSKKGLNVQLEVLKAHHQSI